MSCGEPVSRYLEAYFDGELDVVRSVEMERHLAECSACAAALADHRALRAALADPSLRFEPPKAVEDRVRREVRGSAASSRPALRAPRWMGIAAAVPVIAALAWALVALPQASRDESVNREIVSAHVRSMMADHLTDVTSSNRHTVKPWFNGKLDFSPDVVDLADQGFPLVGGRLDYIDGRPVAALVYRRGGHVINVFAWPAGDRPPRDGETTTRGYNVIRWQRAGTSYSAVSDLNASELRDLARDLQR